MKCLLVTAIFLHGCVVSFSQPLATTYVREKVTIPADPLSFIRHDTILHALELGDKIYGNDLGMAPRAREVVNFTLFLWYASYYSIDTIKKYVDKKYNKVLRVYSAWALALRGEDSVEYLTADLLQDADTVYYSCGCIIGQEFTTRQFMYLLYSGKIDVGLQPLSSRSLRNIKNKYGLKSEKVMQPCRSSLLPLKAF